MVLDQVKIALAKTLNIKNEASIQPTDRLKEDLGLDSMSSLTFLMTLEETINGFVVDPDTLGVERLQTVGSITAYIEQQLTNQTFIPDIENLEEKYA